MIGNFRLVTTGEINKFIQVLIKNFCSVMIYILKQMKYLEVLIENVKMREVLGKSRTYVDNSITCLKL